MKRTTPKCKRHRWRRVPNPIMTGKPSPRRGGSSRAVGKDECEKCGKQRWVDINGREISR